jgi:hypothetical protein
MDDCVSGTKICWTTNENGHDKELWIIFKKKTVKCMMFFSEFAKKG